MEKTTEHLVAPMGLSHLVLNVRDMEESHRFYTEVMGLKKVGELRPTDKRPQVPKMRFYVGDMGAETNHHDLALVENTKLKIDTSNELPTPIHHIAFAYPNRQAWLERLKHLDAIGIKFGRRLEHGMTRSLYITDPNGYMIELLYDLPRKVWEGNRDAALNYLVEKSVTGEEAFEDSADDFPKFTKIDLNEI